MWNVIAPVVFLLFGIWIITGAMLGSLSWPIKPLRRRILSVEYHTLSSGDVFRPMGPKQIKHRCAHGSGWDETRKSIWICHCGRMYFRGWEQVGRWRKRRNYWWRIRPHRMPTYMRARDLKKHQYKKVTIGGVS